MKTPLYRELGEHYAQNTKFIGKPNPKLAENYHRRLLQEYNDILVTDNSFWDKCAELVNTVGNDREALFFFTVNYIKDKDVKI